MPINPILLVFAAGGVAAVVGKRKKKKKKRDVLRCVVKGDVASVNGWELPRNLAVTLEDTYCSHTSETKFTEYVNVEWDYQSTDDFLDFLKEVVVPAAVENPEVGFSLARSVVSGVEVFGGREGKSTLLQIRPAGTASFPGSQHASMGTSLELAAVFEYAMGVLREYRSFVWKDNNGWYWTPSCYAVTGEFFMPDPAYTLNIHATEADTLENVLAVPGDTAWGYVDYLMATRASDKNWADIDEKSEEYARVILSEMAPPCDVPTSLEHWAPEFRIFYDNMVRMIRGWIVDATHEIPFEGKKNG